MAARKGECAAGRSRPRVDLPSSQRAVEAGFGVRELGRGRRCVRATLPRRCARASAGCGCWSAPVLRRDGGGAVVRDTCTGVSLSSAARAGVTVYWAQLFLAALDASLCEALRKRSCRFAAAGSWLSSQGGCGVCLAGLRSLGRGAMCAGTRVWGVALSVVRSLVALVNGGGRDGGWRLRKLQELET